MATTVHESAVPSPNMYMHMYVHVTRVLCAVSSPLSHCARDGCVSIGLTQRLCVSTEASGTHARSGAHGAAEFVS